MGIPVPYKMKFSKFDNYIVSMAFFVFPLGWILTLFRLITTHRHNRCKGRNYHLLGWVFLLSYIAMMLIIYYGYDSFGEQEIQEYIDLALSIGFFFVLPAIVFFIYASRADKKFGGLLRIYTDCVINRRLTSVDHIAVEARQSPAHVIRDLDYMIKEKMLPYGTIENGILAIESNTTEEFDDENSEARDHIVEETRFTPRSQKSSNSMPSAQSQNHRQSAGPKQVECPGCGARVVLTPSEEKECEYCGSTICA